MKLGEARAGKLAARVVALKQAASPDAVVKEFKEIQEAYAAARILAPNLPPGAEADAAKAAGARMEKLSDAARTNLRDKLTAMQKDIGQRDTIVNSQRAESEEYATLCQKMADTEETFREALKSKGAGRQPDVRELTLDSQKRSREYTVLANAFRRIVVRQGPVGGLRRW